MSNIKFEPKIIFLTSIAFLFLSMYINIIDIGFMQKKLYQLELVPSFIIISCIIFSALFTLEKFKLGKGFTFFCCTYVIYIYLYNLYKLEMSSSTGMLKAIVGNLDFLLFLYIPILVAIYLSFHWSELREKNNSIDFSQAVKSRVTSIGFIIVSVLWMGASYATAQELANCSFPVMQALICQQS